jgi:magnesium-transporting ATPase (P-type)
MKDTKQIFHILSYLQYPLLILAIYFSIKPYFNGMQYLIENIDILFENYNYFLIFMGLGISFSTLQDTRKTSLNFEKKIWENPKKGKTIIVLISLTTFLILAFGIFGYFITSNENIKELSFGAIVLGIGLIGFLKVGIEVFENHREDKT